MLHKLLKSLLTKRVKRVETQSAEAEGARASGAGGGRDSPFKAHQRYPSPIRPDDTLGDIYYKFYDESHTMEIHAPV
ncbi:hypothetical protein Hanom_Chr16g01472441 [Helianthus anomalus]